MGRNSWALQTKFGLMPMVILENLFGYISSMICSGIFLRFPPVDLITCSFIHKKYTFKCWWALSPLSLLFWIRGSSSKIAAPRWTRITLQTESRCKVILPTVSVFPRFSRETPTNRESVIVRTYSCGNAWQQPGTNHYLFQYGVRWRSHRSIETIRELKYTP